MSDVGVAICIGITQLLLAAIGIHLTLKTATKTRWPWILLVFLLGAAGVAFTAFAAWRNEDTQAAANANILSARTAAQQAQAEARTARREEHEAERRLRQRLDQVATETQSSVTKSGTETQSSVYQMLHPPRVLSQDQQNTIIQLLRQGGPHEVLIHTSPGKESEDYGGQLSATFVSAGWKVRELPGKTPYQSFGLMVIVHDTHKAPAGAAQLLSALHFAGVRVGVGQTQKVGDGVCVLVVGLNESSK